MINLFLTDAQREKRENDFKAGYSEAESHYAIASAFFGPEQGLATLSRLKHNAETGKHHSKSFVDGIKKAFKRFEMES